MIPLPQEVHPSALLLNWRELLCRTSLKGLAKEVAASSAVDELDDHHVLLAVASQTLVNEAIQQEIREALEKALGHPFAVHFAPRERSQDEPSVSLLVETERRKARLAMITAFKSDPFVQKCVQLLQAKVIDASVRDMTDAEFKETETYACKHSGPAGAGPENAKKR